MAYELHIERQDGEITLDEWCSAVRSTDGVRLADRDAAGVNPSTGEEIRIQSGEGDSEVRHKVGGMLGLGQKQEWMWAFRFSHGRATFKATDSIESPKNMVHQVAAKLASRLGAVIVGDEGETYDW